MDKLLIKREITMLKFSQFPRHLIAKLELDGKKYTLDRFKIGFKHSIDFKGQPQHETHGGQMSLTISQAADSTLYEWVCTATKRKAGTIVFQTQSEQTVIRITFKDAYCVRIERQTDDKQWTKSSIVIAPGYVKMNETAHTNYWI